MTWKRCRRKPFNIPSGTVVEFTCRKWVKPWKPWGQYVLKPKIEHEIVQIWSRIATQMSDIGLCVLSDNIEGCWQDTWVYQFKGIGVQIYQIFGIGLQIDIHLESQCSQDLVGRRKNTNFGGKMWKSKKKVRGYCTLCQGY
jgi:hypothetical protein